jgi:hypothetical protein
VLFPLRQSLFRNELSGALFFTHCCLIGFLCKPLLYYNKTMQKVFIEAVALGSLIGVELAARGERF